MDQVSQIREKTDIVALISSYITLKRAGANFKSLCPFHTDKTPSFVVSPERQIWHCFGCGKGGDCFSFLMEYEHIEFPEALRILADKTGIVLENQKFDSGLQSKKERFYAMNHLAAEFYHFLLTKHLLGKRALEYVLGRSITQQTLTTYMLGYAPRGSSLVTYLHQKKKFEIEDILEAGLATRHGGDVVDFFQGRLMFPLYDHRGNIIGYSGRVLGSSDYSSKYINTSETIIYHKGLTFFGLNSAKESIKKEDAAILMEGEFDVISAFQEGITNAVAIKGTALTMDQVQLLSRFCKKIQLCFDTDKAGQEALRRSLPLIEKKGLLATVVILPSGKDPDELIKVDPVAFKKAVQKDMNAYDYLLSKAEKEFDVSSSLGKKQIGDLMLPLLSLIENEIVKEHYLQLLGRVIDTSYDSLVRSLERLQKETVVRKKDEPVVLVRSRKERLEEYLVALLLQSPYVISLLEGIQSFLNDYSWEIPSFGKVLEHVQKYLASHPDQLAKDALTGMPSELTTSFDTCFLLPLSALSDKEEWISEVERTKHDLYMLFVKEKMKQISEKMKQKEKDATEEEIEKLRESFNTYARILGKE